MFSRYGRMCVLFLMMYGIGSICYPQEMDMTLKKEMEEIKAGQRAIIKQLQEMKLILTQKNPSAVVPQLNIRGVEFELGNNPIKGNDQAKLIMVDFTDYQCPYCGRYARETFPQVVEQFVASGKLRYAIVDVPLPMHKLAPKAAEASYCAKEQGKFWEMHERLMSKQDALDDLASHAASLELDVTRFDDCLKDGKYANEVSHDLSLASKLGISGVPGFVLAKSDPQNPRMLKGISIIRGAQPFDSIKKEIEQALLTVLQ